MENKIDGHICPICGCKDISVEPECQVGSGYEGYYLTRFPRLKCNRCGTVSSEGTVVSPLTEMWRYSKYYDN